MILHSSRFVSAVAGWSLSHRTHSGWRPRLPEAMQSRSHTHPDTRSSPGASSIKPNPVLTKRSPWPHVREVFVHREEPNEAMVGDLVLVCSHCTLEFVVNESRSADLSSALWCPVCGGRELHGLEAPEDAAAVPQEAA